MAPISPARGGLTVCTAHIILTFVPALLLGTTQLLFFVYIGTFSALSSVGLTNPVRHINKAKVLIKELTMEEANGKKI